MRKTEHNFQVIDSKPDFPLDSNFTLGVISIAMTHKAPEPLVCKNYQPTLKRPCGHRWYPKAVGELPDLCPKCKSPHWNKPSKELRAS